jgi:paraquat-inducible protein A
MRTGPDTALVFSLTGLTLALPALLQPFVSAGIASNERVSILFTGTGSLWDRGMQPLAVLVLMCGWLLPCALLIILAVLHAPSCLGWKRIDYHLLERIFSILGHWAIPEVQVLAVLVALMKLSGVIAVTIGPGFWFYCAMALSLLIAQHSSEYRAPSRSPDTTDIGIDTRS